MRAEASAFNWPASAAPCGRPEAGLPRLFGLESEFEERQMEAELQFVNGLIKDIESGDLEGLDMWGPSTPTAPSRWRG